MRAFWLLVATLGCVELPELPPCEPGGCGAERVCVAGRCVVAAGAVDAESVDAPSSDEGQPAFPDVAVDGARDPDARPDGAPPEVDAVILDATGDGPLSDGPPSDGPPSDGPPSDGPPSDGPVPDGSVPDGPPPDGAELDVTPLDGPPPDGPPLDAPGPDAPEPDLPVADAAIPDVPIPDMPILDMCVPEPEVCNGVTDDCDEEIDEDAPCGWGACVEGSCGCDEGAVDCDGWCARLDRDLAHCRACGAACAAGELCGANGCVSEAECTNPKITCGTQCVNRLTDAEHCGACDSPCAPEHSDGGCQLGVCELGACDEGFVDVDGAVGNGCECEITEGGVEVCDGLDNDCNGLVDDGLDTSRDVEHCGACLQPCAPAGGVGLCVAGLCEVGGCEPGRVDANGDPGDGCEDELVDEPSLVIVDPNGAEGTFPTYSDAVASVAHDGWLVVQFTEGAHSPVQVVRPRTVLVGLEGAVLRSADVGPVLEVAAADVRAEGLTVQGGGPVVEVSGGARVHLVGLRVDGDGRTATGVRVGAATDVRVLGGRVTGLQGLRGQAGDGAPGGAGEDVVGIEVSGSDVLLRGVDVEGLMAGDGGDASGGDPGAGGVARGVWLAAESLRVRIEDVRVDGLAGGEGGADLDGAWPGTPGGVEGVHFAGDPATHRIARDTRVDGEPVVVEIGPDCADVEGLTLTGPHRPTNLGGKVVLAECSGFVVRGNEISGHAADSQVPDVVGLMVVGSAGGVVEDNVVRDLQGGPGGGEARGIHVIDGSFVQLRRNRVEGVVGGPRAGTPAGDAIGIQLQGCAECELSVARVHEVGGHDGAPEGPAFGIRVDGGRDAQLNSLHASAITAPNGSPAVGVRLEDLGQRVVDRVLVHDVVGGAPDAIAIRGDSDVTLQRATIAELSAWDFDRPTGVRIGPGARATVIDSIAYIRSRYGVYAEAGDPAGTGQVVHSLLYGTQLGPQHRPFGGGVAMDPRSLEMEGFTPGFSNSGNDDYTLAVGALCVDAGSLPCQPDSEPVCAGEDGCESDIGFYAGTPAARCVANE